MSKAERLKDMERVLIQRPWSIPELVERYEVDRSTIYRHLLELEQELPLERRAEDDRYFINKTKYISNVRVNLHEALALYLAARRLFRQTRICQPHVTEALGKLATALRQPMTERLVRASIAVSQQEDAPRLVQVLETLVEGWAEKIKVRIRHQTLHGQRAYNYVISPYLIEPSAWGDATYVIGHSDYHDGIATFKVERIEKAVLTTERYEIPDDFDEQELLRHAWGIWYGEEPTTIRLKFSPHVARRVKESIWHLSETVENTGDGGCIWTAEVGKVQEMVPWVRGWGADCEVLEPETLREALVNETRRLAALYDIQPIPTYQLLWAKTSKDKMRTHSLIYHLIDVAQATRALWKDVLTDSIRAQFAEALGLNVDATGRVLAFWAGLHDLGKASPCFQRKHAPAVAALEDAGLTFPRRFAQETCYHGVILAETLSELFEKEVGLSRRLAGQIARAVGGHHGAWPHPRDLDALHSTHLGDEGWADARGELLQAMHDLYDPPMAEQLGATQQETNALLTLLSGLTSVADWIGSMERYFPYVATPVEPARYAERAAAQARRALGELGWIGWQPPTVFAPFQELFGFDPRPMQQAVVQLAEQLQEPSLVIIEAPTGEGKTEAALYLADHWSRTCQQRGLYVAMPTMATSNQMFSRVTKVLAQRYPTDLVNVHLIHSQAQWRDDVQALRLDTADERQGGTVAAMAWFLPRKRTLLAPFGVGTVDQAFLSVLQARHFFVRLFGLSHKTVIFDEVHAYDTYMSTIFQRLLGWLRAVGTSVVILSATLPAQTRRELLQAYTGDPDTPLSEVSYPTISWAIEGRVGVLPLETSAQRAVTLEWSKRDVEGIAARLTDEVCEGGCAAVICNTVKRAQEIYRALKAADIVPEEDLILFHARFPFAWREKIEQQILSRFSKNGDRPAKAIVVATQVIEQSLDLDFDLMITDLAPVDLLLQRAGRLHRHERKARPEPLSVPRLLIAAPDEKDGVPQWGADGLIYEPYVLLRTYLALQGRDQVLLPAETEALIEAVYGDEQADQDLAPALVGALAKARSRMARSQKDEQDQARERLIAEPDNSRLMNISQALLEEDKPELHRTLQALTRLIPPSVNLVCLHQTPAGLTLEPEGNGPVVDLNQEPDPELTRELAQRTLTVAYPSEVRQHFLEAQIPSGWQEHPLLQNYRVAAFQDGCCVLDDVPYTLRLSRELGLEIHKEVP